MYKYYIIFFNWLEPYFKKGVLKMIKSKKELMIISFIGFLSSAVSYVFTILLFMSFAETNLEKFLYFLCGIINDGVKWFSLITLIKYYRAKLYKNFVAYCILFLMFFTMSLTASISFSVFTVKKQMYDVKKVQNNLYLNTKEQTENLKNDLSKVEDEKIYEINRINTELDGIPLDYITRRKELADKKIELTNFYDKKIAEIKNELDTKILELNDIDGNEVDIKTLKNNAIAGFFETIATVTKINIDNVILIFAVALGVILDVASIALTFDSTFSYNNKREFKKDITKYKNMHLMKKELKDKSEETKEHEKKDKIINFNDFIEYIENNNLDFDHINFNNFKDLIKEEQIKTM